MKYEVFLAISPPGCLMFIIIDWLSLLNVDGKGIWKKMLGRSEL